FGESEIGKFLFAKHLAALLETGTFERGDRPLQDTLILPDATGIDAMRELKSFLWQKPAIASKRTVVINDADALTPQAQNAILKITEEPPEHALVILIAQHPENILPPLVSRLQKIYFGRLNVKEMAEMCADKEIAEAAFGRPGRAVRLQSDERTKEARKAALGFLNASGPARSKMIKEFIEEQKEQPELLDLFFESLILTLAKDPVKNRALLADTLHRLFLIKSYNTNKRLQLEAIG
ncbi:MAG: hypothetical protein KGI60_04615, partial [Patescibacteria group bacterium]|nr:hypothetical protein [Patescibacteria group bacterium]